MTLVLPHHVRVRRPSHLHGTVPLARGHLRAMVEVTSQYDCHLIANKTAFPDGRHPRTIMFTITRYNVRGLPKHRKNMYFRPDSVFNGSDIVCVQDIWYAIQDLHMLNNLHSKFRGSGVSTTDYNE